MQPRVLLLTFTESFAGTCVQRGLYFHSTSRLGFSRAANLWLALGFGITYAAAAVLSHRLAGRYAEKHLLLASVGGQVLVFLAMGAAPGFTSAVVAGALVLGALNGLKWPVVESYVAAGRGPAEQARALGRFNVSWALAIPLSVAATGPMMGLFAGGLFVVPAAVSCISVLLLTTFPVRPRHLDATDPQRPPADQMGRLVSLMRITRWLLLANYSCVWVLAALLPGVLTGLGLAIGTAAVVASALDVVRLTTFAGLQRASAWQNRLAPLVGAAVLIPAGFFMVFFAPNVAVAMAGEIVFGLATALSYYATFYYAMVVRNAAVDAGGGNETLIGLGSALGPVAALLGIALAPALGQQGYGLVIGLAPVFVVCLAGAARSATTLLRTSR
jgi:MFS family permease